MAACFGGFVRNIKRRDTPNYQLATAGNKQLCLWNIDPINGEMVCDKIQSEGRGNQVREFTCLAFSEDLETLYAGTSSGDFIISKIKTKSMVNTIPVTRQGIKSFLTSSNSLLIGGGDGSVTRLDSESMHDLQQTHIKGPVCALSYSPDLTEVLAGTSNGFIYRLRADSLQGRLVCENHSNAIVCIDFSPETSERFATLSTV